MSGQVCARAMLASTGVCGGDLLCCCFVLLVTQMTVRGEGAFVQVCSPQVLLRADGGGRSLWWWSIVAVELPGTWQGIHRRSYVPARAGNSICQLLYFGGEICFKSSARPHLPRIKYLPRHSDNTFTSRVPCSGMWRKTQQFSPPSKKFQCPPSTACSAHRCLSVAAMLLLPPRPRMRIVPCGVTCCDRKRAFSASCVSCACLCIR